MNTDWDRLIEGADKLWLKRMVASGISEALVRGSLAVVGAPPIGVVSGERIKQMQAELRGDRHA